MNCKLETGLELFTALDIRPDERVLLVGGEGKTTLARKLVAAAQRLGWTTLSTTTTKLLAPEQGSATFAMINNRQLDLALVVDEGSRQGFCSDLSAYQPVIPLSMTLLVFVVGLSVVGQTRGAGEVYDLERLAGLGGVSQQVPVDPVLIATVLAHPDGGLKGCPPGVRAVAVLAQAAPQRVPAGREIARRLLDSGRFERVLLVDMHAPGVAGEVWQGSVTGGFQVGPASEPRVAAAVLAAGQSRRLGQNKLLLPLGGRPLIAHAVTAALGSRAAAVSVVLGAAADEVRDALVGQPVHFLVNPEWASGQAASVRTAVAGVPTWTVGVLFLTGDMPFVTPAHLDRLLERWRSGVAVVWSGYDGDRGIPALFGQETYAALQQLHGDSGGRALAGQYVEEVVPADFPPLDVDTAEGYQQVCRWWASSAAGA
jgi:molybdenum cofactor cytidylyltransferase